MAHIMGRVMDRHDVRKADAVDDEQADQRSPAQLRHLACGRLRGRAWRVCRRCGCAHVLTRTVVDMAGRSPDSRAIVADPVRAFPRSWRSGVTNEPCLVYRCGGSDGLARKRTYHLPDYLCAANRQSTRWAEV